MQTKDTEALRRQS